MSMIKQKVDTRRWGPQVGRCPLCYLGRGAFKAFKAFLNKQCKEVEQNNRMGKTSDTSKKTGDIKGTFHERMGTIKDKNEKNLTEAEEIKKR